MLPKAQSGWFADHYKGGPGCHPGIYMHSVHSSEAPAKMEASFHSDSSANPEEQYSGSTESVLNNLATKYGVNRRKLMLKMDFCIIPPICILYLLAFLDRVNISNAAIYGLSEELHLPTSSLQYNIALCIFFVPYIIFEIPSNYFLKKFSPSVWLSGCMVCFGVCCLCMGFIHNYSQLLAIRFLLGVFESGMFPGCFYLLATWYRREEAQKRYTFFFSSTSLAGAFGGLIAYGVHNIDGAKGYSSWRWLFIIEGAITVFLAIVMYFFIVDFPEKAKFLKENERSFLKEKLALDQGESHVDDKIQLKSVLNVFKEWKVWIAGLMYFGAVVPAYGYAYFATTIIKGFHYSSVKTQVYSIFPWLVSFGGGMIFAVFSDLTCHRYFFTFFGGILSLAGFGLLLGLEAVESTINARYAACFLICLGMYGTMPIIVCWTNMNFSGHYRKMVGSAWQVGFGNIGGIIAVFIYRTKDAAKSPQYALGNSVSLAMVVVSMLACFTYAAGIYIENKNKRLGKTQQKWDRLSEQEQRDAGDLNPKFFYRY